MNSQTVTIYNYPYYPVHLERLGYVKDTDMVEYQMTRDTPIPEARRKSCANCLDQRRLSVGGNQVQ